MVELSARTAENDVIVERKAWSLHPGDEAILQRNVIEEGPSIDSISGRPVWPVDWDKGVSRERHIGIRWDGKQLHVNVLPPDQSSPNREKPPIWFENQPVTELTLSPGQEFWLGQTAFSVREQTPNVDEFFEQTCSAQEMAQLRISCEADKFDALVRLPELIRCSTDEQELYDHVLDVLFEGIQHADQVAVVSLASESTPGNPVIKVQSFKQRGARGRLDEKGEFRVSRRVIDRAMTRRQPYIHLYRGDNAAPDLIATEVGNNDWAACIPLMAENYQQWGLYLAGRQARGFSPNDRGVSAVAQSDFKFTQVVSETFGALLQSLDLERRLSLIGRVLSPRVLAALKREDVDRLDDVLKERLVDMTVLFCDLRNSCQIVQRGSQDLLNLWRQIGRVLSIMTRAILSHQGVIGDFQGDAAMGFWGWPKDQTNQAILAARAALEIRRQIIGFNEMGENAGESWSCGIGLAHGQAVAGKLGAWDQIKIGVFGPVVNRAARLESFTKQAGVPIVLDDATARLLSEGTGLEYRMRRLIKVSLVGIDEPVLTHELLPSTEYEPGPNRRESARRDHEAALDAFMTEEWDRAQQLLNRLPNGDPIVRMIRTFMEENPDGPPTGWDGAIPLFAK